MFDHLLLKVIIIVTFLLVSPAAWAATDDGEYHPDAKFSALLTRAISDAKIYPKRNDHGNKEIVFATASRANQEAAVALTALTYPNIKGLSRIRIDYEISFGHEFEPRHTTAWLVSENERELVIVNNNFVRLTVAKQPENYLRFRSYAKTDFLNEIHDLVKHQNFDYWFSLQFVSGGSAGGSVWDSSFNLAIYAAELGYYREAESLIRFGIAKEGEFLAMVANGRAFLDLLTATEELYQHGHEQALPHLQHLVQYFNFTEYSDQAKDLLSGCERVIAAKQRWSNANPDQLDRPAQIDYWIERLPDLVGQQWSDPGAPVLLSFEGEKKLPTDHLVALGRAALPALINCLTDDRPTRSIYWQRSFYPHRFVIKVGDAALACIEAITHLSFYNRGCSSCALYHDSPGVKEKVIADVKSWWAAHKEDSEAEWSQSRLNQGTIYQRTNAAARLIEISGYAAVHPILQQWLSGPDMELHILVAQLMVKHGDASALPQIEQELLAGAYQQLANPFLVSYAIFLIEKHDPDHSAGIMKAYIVKFPAPTSILSTPFAALASRPSRASIEACLELLNCNVLIDNQGEGERQIRIADMAADCFQQISGVNFNFRRDLAQSTRDALIEQMRNWWQQHHDHWQPPPKSPEKSGAGEGAIDLDED